LSCVVDEDPEVVSNDLCSALTLVNSVPPITGCFCSANLTRKEAILLERLPEQYGFIGRSEAIRSAVRLYLNLLELGPKDRLRMLQFNEMIAPSEAI